MTILILTWAKPCSCLRVPQLGTCMIDLHQGIRGSELCQDSKECGEAWSSHWWFCTLSSRQICMNTCTQYMSVNITLPPKEYFLSAHHIHVDTTIVDVILRETTRGSFRQWDKNDHDLTVTPLPHLRYSHKKHLPRIRIHSGDCIISELDPQ